MIQLITRSDFINVGIILPTNPDANAWKRYINEAQEFDVKARLGEVFYYDLLTHYADSNYQELLNAGVAFSYQGYNYQYNGGLKAALCYYAYARYLPDFDKKNTHFGIVQKTNEFSEKVDTKAVQVMVNNANSSAYGLMDGVILYLDRIRVVTPAKYPLWNQGGAPGLFGGNNCSTERRSGIKISKVGNI